MSEIKPALHPDQWAELLEPYEGVPRVQQHGQNAVVFLETFMANIPSKLEAAAACLYGYFTWDDVDLLRNEASMLIGDIDEAEDAHWRSLAARIASLLPPRDVVPKEPA